MLLPHINPSAAIVGLTLCSLAALEFGCTPPAVQEPLAHVVVEQRLDEAYRFAEEGRFEKADSVYRTILTNPLHSADSVSVSSSYVHVLLQLENYQQALVHVDRAFPDDSHDPLIRVRRHSYRQQVFIALGQCDDIMAEQDELLDLVTKYEGLQLSLEDIQANGEVLARRCP